MNEPTSPGALLGSTACWTAAVRAMESTCPDALFHDPWAAALAGEIGAHWIAGRTLDKVISMVLRTRYFDDFVQRMVGGDLIRQVVLMACGYDTRAFRLPWPPGTILYELDQPEVLQDKEAVLAAAGAQPACLRKVIGQNLVDPWQGALLSAGFDAQQPSLWLLEGFLFYLPSPQVRGILEGLTPLAAPGSWLGFDIINQAMLAHPLTKTWVDMQAASGAPWIGTMEDPAGFLAGLGWQASLTQAGQPDANYGRWTLPVLPVAMPNFPHNWFVTAKKLLVSL